MKNRWLGLLMSCTGKSMCYSFCIFTIATMVTIASVQASAIEPEDGQAASKAEPIIATGSTREAITPAGERSTKQPDLRDWQPPTPSKVTIPSPVDPEQEKRLAEQWGVKLISLRLSAAGYMMDFRFRVLHVEKALPLFDQRVKPYIAVVRSGARLPVPMASKVGAFRPTNRGKNIKAGKNYYIVFGNPDYHVKSGEKVDIIIGDFKAENITVN